MAVLSKNKYPMLISPVAVLRSCYLWYVLTRCDNKDNFLCDNTCVANRYSSYIICYTVKPAHVVTSIKQSPVLKGHLFLVVIENLLWIEPLLRGHLSYEATISSSQRWPRNTGLTVYIIFMCGKSSASNANLMIHRQSNVYIKATQRNLKYGL